MSSIHDLRTYIVEECEKSGEVSLVDAFAKFDYMQHVIPTLNQVHRAIEKIESIEVVRENGNIVIKAREPSIEFDPNSITEKDIKDTYEAYLAKLKS